MAFELKNLQLEEVSAVDEPANKASRVVLLKRSEKGGIMDHAERRSLLERLSKYLGVEAPVTKQENVDDMTDGKVEKQLQELTAKVEKLEQEKAAAEAIGKARDMIAKAETTEAVDAAVSKVDEGHRDAIAEQAKARKSEIETVKGAEAFKEFRDKLPKGMQKAFDELEDDDQRKRFMNGFNKSDSDPVAKALEGVTKANEELTARLAKMEAAAELAKVRDELKDLEGIVKVDELAEVYQKLAKGDADAAKAMVDQLRAVAKQAKEGGLFKVLGRDGQGESDADAKLDKAVRKYREEHPEASEAVAMTKVLEAQPELYTEYTAEKEAV